MKFKNSMKSKVLYECLEALGLVLEYNLKDHPLHQHTLRVGEGCVIIGDKLGLNQKNLQRIYLAGLLHDIGKISVPIELLQKRKKLTVTEFEVVQNHSISGSRIISSLPELNKLAFWVRWHHECWDGSGYPDGLVKNEIPVEVQILSAIDCFDSLQTPRMDRNAHTPDEAFQILLKYKGIHYNPEIIDLIFEMHKEKTLVPGRSSDKFNDLKNKYIFINDTEDESEYSNYYNISGLYPVLKLFARVIDAKHHYTSGHSTRVSILSKYIAEQMGFSTEDLIKIEIAGLLHDAGKISIPNELLDKAENPTTEEWETIKKHPLHSSNILNKISIFDDISKIVYYHHSWINGMGYPEINPDDPLNIFSQIIAVADAYDAITTTRAYRKLETPEIAYSIIKEGLGTQFDYHAGITLINTSPKYIKALFDMNGN